MSRTVAKNETGRGGGTPSGRQGEGPEAARASAQASTVDPVAATLRLRLVPPVLLLLTVCLTAVTALVALSGRSQDKAAAERTVRMVDLALEQALDRLGSTARDYAYWDEAVRHLALTVDRGWAERNLAGYMHDNFGVARVLVLDPEGTVTHAERNGRLDAAGLGRQAGADLTALAGRPGPVATGIVRVEGGLYMAATSPIQWQEDPPPVAAPPRVLALLKPLDGARLAAIGLPLLLDDLTLASAGPTPRGHAGLPITAPDGTEVARAVWTPPTPAQDLRDAVRPWGLPLLGLMGALTALILYRAQRVTRHLAVTAGALRQSEERYRALLETVPDLIALVEGGRIVLINGGGARLLGAADGGVADKAAVLGHGWADFVAEADRPAMLRLLASQARESARGSGARGGGKGEQNWFALRLQRPDGETTPVEITVLPVGPLEERLVLVVARDISKHVEVRESLRLAQTRAELADRAKVQFLSNISHELRTPLNAIIGFSEILKDELLGDMGNAQYKDYAIDIHEGGLNLLRLVNDLIDLARIDAGQLELREAWIDMQALADRCLRLVAQKASQAGIDVKAEVAQECRRVLADEVRLKQVIVNLLNNAIRFSQRGGRVVLSVAPGGAGECVLCVADDGPGMTAEDAMLALEAFSQVEGGHNRRQPGAGLGLPLAKGYAEAHGGGLSITSRPGEGTQVRVTLPSTRLSQRLSAAV